MNVSPDKEEAFPPEQVDIQQQMKELLKKQKTVRITEPREEEIDEEDEIQDNEKEIV
jgi:hypothetical protein